MDESYTNNPTGCGFIGCQCEALALKAIEHAIWKLGSLKETYEGRARRLSDGRTDVYLASAEAIEQAITIIKQCRDLRERHRHELVGVRDYGSTSVESPHGKCPGIGEI